MHKWSFAGVTSVDGKLIEVIQAMTDPADLVPLQEIVAAHTTEEALRQWVETQREKDPAFTDELMACYQYFQDQHAILSALPEIPENRKWFFGYIPFARGTLMVAAMRYFTIAGPHEKKFWHWFVQTKAPYIRGQFAPFTPEERGRALTEAVFEQELAAINDHDKEKVDLSKLDDPEVAEETTKKLVEEGITIQPDIFSDEPGESIFPSIRHEFDTMNEEPDKD